MGSCPLKTWEVSGLCHIETIVPLVQGLPFPKQASVVSHTERMKSRSGHCRVNFGGKKERERQKDLSQSEVYCEANGLAPYRPWREDQPHMISSYFFIKFANVKYLNCNGLYYHFFALRFPSATVSPALGDDGVIMTHFRFWLRRT